MTDYKLYPNPPWDHAEGPSAPPENPQTPLGPRAAQVTYHLNVIQAKRQGLLAKEKMFKKKHKKYTKILNRLVWLNTCSSGISIATFATFVRLPVSILLCAASLTGPIASGIISMLTKKYQKKLKKVTKLIDIIKPALVVFEKVISGALKNGIINEEEFTTLQTLHLKTLNELMGIDRTMELENRSLVEKKPNGRDKRTKEKRRNKSLMACSLCYFVCYFKNG